jgi:LPS O-antigen subunit length determinant protein (WzzB/FepE family)
MNDILKPYEDNDSINIIEIFSLFWTNKFKIIFITLIFSVCGVIYSLSLPNIYKSSAVLMTVEDNSSSSGNSLLSQYGSIASFAGISLPSSSADKADYAIELIQSRQMLKRLLKKYDANKIRAKLMAVDEYDPVSKKITYNKKIYNEVSGEWLNYNTFTGLSYPSYLEIYRTSYRNLKLRKDKITGFLIIEFTHKSPEFASEFIKIAVQELNLITKEIDYKKALLSLEYLKNELEKSPQVEIKNSINSLISSQLNTMMLSSVNEDYLLKYLDEPYAPEIKFSPKRSVICILAAIFGLFVALLSVLTRNYLFPIVGDKN